jgi:predicted O-methyltransferase YrrM
MAYQTRDLPPWPRPDGRADTEGEVHIGTCDDVRPLAASIEGWLSDAQGCALFRAASATTGKGFIVEIGSWKGRSTAWLAAGARLAAARVYAVDPHIGSREDPEATTLAAFRANLTDAGLADVVEPLVMTSAKAARMLDGPVELLFIDGDHSYEAVRLDADLWLPKLVEGGIVMFHDVSTTSYTGPRRVFRRSICWSSQFEDIRRIGSMMVARRTRRRDARSAAWGRVAGLLLYLYDAKRGLRRTAHLMRMDRRAGD